jgi:hypothetical protein
MVHPRNSRVNHRGDETEAAFRKRRCPGCPATWRRETARLPRAACGPVASRQECGRVMSKRRCALSWESVRGSHWGTRSGHVDADDEVLDAGRDHRRRASSCRKLSLSRGWQRSARGTKGMPVPASSPAAGFGGTPLARQYSSASTNASWTASSATPTSPTGPPAHRGSGWPPPDRPSPARRHRPRSPVFSCLRPPLTRHHPPRWRHRTCTRGVSPAAPAPGERVAGFPRPLGNGATKLRAAPGGGRQPDADCPDMGGNYGTPLRLRNRAERRLGARSPRASRSLSVMRSVRWRVSGRMRQ